jgi:hypothetical protein
MAPIPAERNCQPLVSLGEELKEKPETEEMGDSIKKAAEIITAIRELKGRKQIWQTESLEMVLVSGISLSFRSLINFPGPDLDLSFESFLRLLFPFSPTDQLHEEVSTFGRSFGMDISWAGTVLQLKLDQDQAKGSRQTLIEIDSRHLYKLNPKFSDLERRMVGLIMILPEDLLGLAAKGLILAKRDASRRNYQIKGLALPARAFPALGFAPAYLPGQIDPNALCVVDSHHFNLLAGKIGETRMDLAIVSFDRPYLGQNGAG